MCAALRFVAFQNSLNGATDNFGASVSSAQPLRSHAYLLPSLQFFPNFHIVFAHFQLKSSTQFLSESFYHIYLTKNNRFFLSKLVSSSTVLQVISQNILLLTAPASIIFCRDANCHVPHIGLRKTFYARDFKKRVNLVSM